MMGDTNRIKAYIYEYGKETLLYMAFIATIVTTWICPKLVVVSGFKRIYSKYLSYQTQNARLSEAVCSFDVFIWGVTTRKQI